MNGLRHWRLLIVLIVSLRVAGATNYSSWSIRAWQTDDGLPNNDITSLAETPDGYLWMAAISQLVRFDGVQFEEFSPKDFGAPDQKVTSILAVPNGFWVGLDHGPVAFLNSKINLVFTNGLPDRVTQQLLEDGEGALWINYRGGFIYRLRKGEVKQFTAADGLPGGYGASLARDATGGIWLARGGGLGLFRNDQFILVAQLPKGAAWLTPSRDGGMWACAGSQLLEYTVAGGLKKQGVFNCEHPDSEPAALLEDRNGGVWIGTSDSGLFHFDGSHFENIPVSHRSISSLLEDAEGNIWAGTSGGGIDRVRPRVITLESEETGLPFETVQSLCEATNGTVWATTLNGMLICRKGNEWSTVSTNSNWPGGRPTCVTADQTGGIWIGTRDRELHHLHDGRFTSWDRNAGLAGHTIHCLMAAANGDLWIGEETPDVVQRLHAGKMETFPMPAGIRMTRTMTEDAAGDVWVGSSKGYLVRISNGHVIDETTRLGSNYMSIRCLQTTPDGTLWIGFADDGLGWLRSGRFAHITSAQGLCDDKLSQIVGDNDGWLWFGGDHGIFKVRQKELADVAEGRSAHVRPIRYGPNEGMMSLQANFGDSPGALRTHDGRIWIPTRTALTVADPKRLHENSNPPRVLLKRVTVDDKAEAFYGGVLPVRDIMDLQSPAPLRLSPGHRRLEFEFTALNFAAPENVRFRYRLEGFDDDWTVGAAQRAASYSRLSAGKYLFRVMACNGDGVWNERGAGLALIVAPFFWQTWWFRIGAIALVIGAVRYVSFRRLRFKLQMLEQQAALDQERARIAKDLHDDLGSRLTKIVLLSGLAQRDQAMPKKTDEHLEKLATMSRQVIKSLDETVWAVNPRNDTLPDLINYIGQFAVDFLHTAEIKCRLDLPEHPLQRVVPAKVRHNLFLAVKEALNNTVRHSHAKEVELRITSDDNALAVIIDDNGEGFDRAPKDSSAEGLRNMQQRMDEIGGQFRLESKSGAGTRISFSCPWQNGKLSG